MNVDDELEDDRSIDSTAGGFSSDSPKVMQVSGLFEYWLHYSPDRELADSGQGPCAFLVDG